jgi:hypothetical protein
VASFFWTSYFDSGMIGGMRTPVKARRDTYTTGIAPYNHGNCRPPLYVSAKRTHRFFREKMLYPFCLQRFVRETMGIFRWVRFGKRTHREGVLAVDMMVLSQNLERFWTLTLLGESP